LADNSLNLKAGEELSQLLRQTFTLEYLNISGCQIRDNVAGTISDGLLVNRTL
jgi:hypothetical protein